MSGELVPIVRQGVLAADAGEALPGLVAEAGPAARFGEGEKGRH